MHCFYIGLLEALHVVFSTLDITEHLQMNQDDLMGMLGTFSTLTVSVSTVHIVLWGSPVRN